MQELDLSNCKLRDFDDIFNQERFPSLVELNLSANLLSTTKMIGNLPKLKILILNTNKLENLICNLDTSQKKGLNGC